MVVAMATGVYHFSKCFLYTVLVYRDFPIQYEGPHVISKEQVWVGVVSKGCDNVALNSSYANR